ncbi:MAG: TIGR02921 family PEP-CTERM protein [Cyanobacteria bacterium P01_A01_bin.116]
MGLLKRLRRLDFKTVRHIISHLVFWTWNLTFIALMYFWLLPQVGFDLIQAARSGEIDPTFTASFIALLVVPLVSTILGFFRLRKYPILLMRLFYGVEAPLFALCLLRLFLIRELTLASGFLIGTVVVAIAMFAIELLAGYSAYRPKLAKLQLVSHSLILVVGLYLGALLFLYSLPALTVSVVGGLTAFFSLDWLSGLGYFFQDIVSAFIEDPTSLFIGLWVSFIGSLFGFLFITSAAIFFSMPYTLVNFYVRAWARIRTAFGKQHGENQSWTITGITIATVCLLFIGTQGQPQTKAFNLLGALPGAETPNQYATPTAEQVVENRLAYRQAQLDNAPAIRAGLTQAYLHRYRYLSPWSQSNQLKQMYRDVFQLNEGGAQFFQSIHNALLSPFLYRGEDGDADTAAELYAQVFDTSIQQAERPAIRKALQATANRDETSAGLLNLDQKIVRLARQSVAVTEQADWATVEIHEQYENLTNDDQEIFYSFSLPESAAITGLWLGDTANPKLFPFVVSPRGAAQQVYNGEVERGQRQPAVDPALLEQVGPRQYRLRVYPIPAATVETTFPYKRIPGSLDLQMTYQVMQQDGAWPLPQLTEKRSIYWNDNTEHQRGDRTIALSRDQWFESSLPASKPSKPIPHKVQLTDGQLAGYQISATPITNKEQQLPRGKQFAIVVDSSYSMGQHKQALKQAVNSLKPASKNNTLDFYLTAADSAIVPTTSEASGNEAIAPASITPAPITPQAAINVDKTLFYGSLQPAEMLQQLATSAGPDKIKNYDAVLLLTDEGSYELTNAEVELPEIPATLWMVHVDGKLPSAYEDSLLQQLQASEGGVEIDAIAPLYKMALAEKGTTSLDGYLWKVEPDASASEDAATTSAAASQFDGIAARQLIYQLSRTLDTSEVSALDSVHAIAKNTGIVTPYSSMLVLVDERQKQLLKEAEAADDRFEREVEDGQDVLTQPGNPVTASVPEPSQVLSLLVGAAALVLLKRKSNATRSDRISPEKRGLSHF